MCTQPLLIRNKKHVSLSVQLPTTFLKVPCGCCDECLRKRAKDLYIRARFEAQRSILRGGCGFMCTLTYDDTNLPKLFHLGKEYMVFNKKDVQNFIKRLRTNLDRYYKKHFNTFAPDFKYLVTSEFGSNPYCTHRPHYHCIFLFEKPISLYIFRLSFQSCLIDSRKGKPFFGKIFQCDSLDFSKGGIRYSAKYILKDQAYSDQNIIIRKLINFKIHYVNSKHGIIEFPESEADFMVNRCIRSTKEYKKDIETYVSPYRNMLQFYLCSNDFGASAIIEHYGENLFTLGVLNIDKLPYSIPKAVIQRLERTQGSKSRDIINKTVFLGQFRTCLDDLYARFKLDRSKGEALYCFAKEFLYPKYGFLYFASPFSSYYDAFTGGFHRSLDDVINEYNFYDDNDFISMRNEVYKILRLSTLPSVLEFRAAVAHRKSVRERENYLKRKFNQS